MYDLKKSKDFLNKDLFFCKRTFVNSEETRAVASTRHIYTPHFGRFRETAPALGPISPLIENELWPTFSEQLLVLYSVAPSHFGSYVSAP